MMIDSLVLVLSYTLTIAIIVFMITVVVTIWEELRWIVKDAVAKLRTIYRNRKGDEQNKKR